ncbi:hypothetical protein CH373_13555 [Leptospira perolatii]|uniref:DUF1353 domain-containing protein n=1 Tax=Leptospira perolatii TaxID=2023191 RepID=A0A2M9ZLA3_9LEPT|nr:DUF1353 domain-containing protein [Leptospira perolatii]PJZ69869.1 hypothetical protein CH360_08130 [Leptospira perolatii]PJZ72723.1 hypothetical protein CH373_13555 [Leptospira perolatii]
MADHIKYRTLRNYKYQLLYDYTIQIDLRPASEIIEPHQGELRFIRLKQNGQLTIFEGYAWDGPSGPTIDTPNFMRGSLVHDALYQLMRNSRLDQSTRKYADDLLHDLCIEDGMSKLRAKWVHWAVRTFGGSAAAPGSNHDYEELTAP